MTLPESISWDLCGSDEGAFKSAVTDLYWRSVKEEARHLIVALADLMKDCPEPLAIEKVQAQPHRERQNLFAKAWSNVELDDEALESVRATYGRFLRDDYGKPLIERRARQMLQAVGWLDIDFVHQDRPLIYPSMSGLPYVEELDYGNVIRAMQCSLCRRCIRTQYFECRKGCLDRSSTHNYYKCFPPACERTQSNIRHLLPRLMLATFRLCFSCMVSTDKIIPDADCTYLRSGYKDRLKQEPHLRSANVTSRHQSPNALAFRRELNALEDFQEGGQAATEGFIAMILARVMGSGFRGKFPAGNVHMAFRFGPLAFENGVPRSQSGVLVHAREMLNIAYSPTPSLVGDKLSCEKIKKVALSSSRETYTKTEPRDVRRTLAVIKQVCGGFGTGYCDSWVMAEENIITIMANAAAAHQSRHPMVPISRKRAEIHKAAAEMVALMREAVSDAVEVHLSRISSHLFAASVKLTWHKLKNNCQTFCNLLLQAKHFNTVYPPFVTSGNQLPGFGDLETPYLHSFASPTHYPLFAEQKDLDKALRHSDVGAYMSSFHNTADLVSFAFGRKIIFDFTTPNFQDPVLCKQCVNCDHKLPQSAAFEELADLIRLSDHVLDDPFGAVTLLASHLDRPRALYVDEKGWAWHGSESQRRRRWAENRIHVLAALNVFLSFTKSVFIASYRLVQGKPGEEVRFRVADSNVAGRAVYKTAWEDLLDLSDNWEMQPVRSPSGSVRRRLQATLVWVMSSGSAGHATWRQCPCRYCGMNDDQLDEFRGRGG